MKTHIRLAAGIAMFFGMSFAMNAQTLNDAIRLTENEQYINAKAAFKKLVAAEPTNGDNYFYFGDLLLKMDDVDSALVVFQKGCDIAATNPLVHVGKGRALLFAGKMEEGMKELAQAEALLTAQSGKKGTLTPRQQAVIYCELAESWAFCPSPDYDKAIDFTNKAEKQDPTYADIFLTRGDILVAKDPVNGTPAIEAYKKAASVDPKSARANVRIGRLYANGKNPSEAIKFYNMAIAIEPNFGPAYREKGEAWYQIQKFDSASACYSKYLSLNPDCYASYRYAAFLYKSGNYDKAIEQGNNVIACDSNLVIVIYRIMGRCYLEKKTPEPAQAIIYFKIFLKKQAQFGKPKLMADDYVMLGKAQSKGGNDSLAIIEFKKAIVLDTANKEVYYEIGTSYFKMKKYGEAAVWYKKKYDAEAGKSLTQKVTNLNAFAKALYLNKEYGRSDSAYSSLIALDSNLTYGWLGRAQSNGKLDPDGAKLLARPYYERYFSIATVDSVTKVKNSKDLINAGLYLASANMKDKNYACAKAYYLFVQGLDPKNATAQAGLEDKDVKAATAAEIRTCVMPKK